MGLESVHFVVVGVMLYNWFVVLKCSGFINRGYPMQCVILFPNSLIAATDVSVQ